MVDHTLLLLALRAPARAAVVCTTGATTLAATSTGYSRAAGSFIADGFKPGMEVTPASFTQTDPGVITDVQALTITIAGGRTVQSAGSGRTLSVSALPALMAWDNVALEPIAGRPYAEEELVPTGGELMTTRSQGTVIHNGLYLLRLYGLAGMGPEAIAAAADALLLAFAPAAGWTLSNGDSLRINGDTVPYRSAIQADTPGWAVATVTIPYHVLTTNPA